MKRTERKLILFLLLVFMCAGLRELEVKADTSSGDDLYYTLDSGILTIGGEGSMGYLYSEGEAPWYDSRESIRKVVIRDDVTDVCNYAFCDCSNLTYVELGKSVKTIGEYAFKNCSSLEEVWIPDEVTEINYGAFQSCTSLTKVHFPDIDKLSKIGNAAFYNCSKLTGISLPGTIREIGSDAFARCSSITQINIPECTNSIGPLAFTECPNLSKITVDTGNYSYYVKDGLLIEEYTDSLGYPVEVLVVCAGKMTGEVVIPDSVSGIKAKAFSNSPDLKKITIPAKVNSILPFAFYGARHIELAVDSENDTFFSNDGVIYDKEMTTLLFCAGGKNGVVTVPEGVKEIGENSCLASGLIDIHLPESLEIINDSAFKDCSELTSIIIPGKLTKLGYMAFSGCTGLKTVTFNGEYPPTFYNYIFENVTADVYYPYFEESDGWWRINDDPGYYQYGGTISWHEVKKEGWLLEDGVWHFYRDGDMMKGCVTIIEDEWVEFDENGVMISGHRYDGSNWYDANGNLVCNGNHSYETTITKATLSTDGSMVKKCVNCGQVETNTVIYHPKNLALSATSYLYDGKVKKPNVVITDTKDKVISAANYTVSYAAGRKSVGTYKVTVNMKGNYSGSKTLTFVINPKGTSLKKLKAAKKALTVTWLKQSEKMSSAYVTGYELQLATDKAFKKNVKKVIVKKYSKVSNKVKGLKAKKTYYVRIRTYMKAAGSTYYSAWSAVKNKKVK